ncbi:Malonyl-[acyl-carrier protein] O-methyltransferase [Planctopirus ephydatiae]|uniref:Malonyl-[acyl-carrier protein] O-methyltransferase n=1 Tax=Planctopirus ephydatiae TaxID=2528019 RepID=A0A518GN05_9PLAN|nr:class I SAM-dependent methyltransferase [Planctopirus ephydatiae]QDV29998.1 Malonyl-[acyl-carrier protein] O-methyltransferase [Planctopirus ephydatiae]
MTGSAVVIRTESVVCPLCQTSEWDPVFAGEDRFSGVPGIFQVVECQRCGHLYTNPCPTRESLSSCYPEEYQVHQSALTAIQQKSAETTDRRSWLSYVPGVRAFYRFLRNDRGQIVPLPPSSERSCALEVGCSAGDFLQKLRSAGWQAQGVELVHGPAEAARQRGFEVFEGVFEEAPLEKEKFDHIFAWMVLEHTVDPVAVLTKMRGLLRPGGKIYFSVPNCQVWDRYLFGKEWQCWDLPRHLQHFHPATLKLALRKSGLESIRIIPQASVYTLLGSIGLALSRSGNDWCRKCGQKFLSWNYGAPPLAVWAILAVIMQFTSRTVGSSRITVIASKPA